MPASVRYSLGSGGLGASPPGYNDIHRAVSRIAHMLSQDPEHQPPAREVVGTFQECNITCFRRECCKNVSPKVEVHPVHIYKRVDIDSVDEDGAELEEEY